MRHVIITSDDGVCCHCQGRLREGKIAGSDVRARLLGATPEQDCWEWKMRQGMGAAQVSLGWCAGWHGRPDRQHLIAIHRSLKHVKSYKKTCHLEIYLVKCPGDRSSKQSCRCPVSRSSTVQKLCADTARSVCNKLATSSIQCVTLCLRPLILEALLKRLKTYARSTWLASTSALTGAASHSIVLLCFKSCGYIGAHLAAPSHHGSRSCTRTSQQQAKSSALYSSAATEMNGRFKSAAGIASASNEALCVMFSYRYFREMPWVALDYNGNDELKVASFMKRLKARDLCV